MSDIVLAKRRAVQRKKKVKQVLVIYFDFCLVNVWKIHRPPAILWSFPQFRQTYVEVSEDKRLA